MKKSIPRIIIATIILFLIFTLSACYSKPNLNSTFDSFTDIAPLSEPAEREILVPESKNNQTYEADHIIRHIEKQLLFGPRIPGSLASQSTSNYFKEFLEQFGWFVEFQEFDFDGVPLRNVIAMNSKHPPQVIIGTHYDTRAKSDQEFDLSKSNIPVPGAIDGGSGSAILLELGRAIAHTDRNVWLVFFDGEDQGDINEWQWSIGAEYFAQNLGGSIPQKVVIIDMLGDDNLEIFKENNSNAELSDSIWHIASQMGYSNSFIDEYQYTMIDDHLPFINRNIPSALLIDFDYPYWHTTLDTLDKVSAQNLEIVFSVLSSWLSSLESN